MNSQEHWESVYRQKAADEVSWYRAHLETSLGFMERAAAGNRSAAIADIGGGASTLVDDLVERGYGDITVLDISQRALSVARTRLGKRAERVRWVCADVTDFALAPRSVDVWHDRAVFHFLTDAEKRRDYVRAVLHALRPGGHVIVSTFGPEGPLRCSGLETVRYDAEHLHAEFGSRFALVESAEELHETPFGTRQQFLYCHCLVELKR